jgi:hypothetical protein
MERQKGSRRERCVVRATLSAHRAIEKLKATMKLVILILALMWSGGCYDPTWTQADYMDNVNGNPQGDIGSLIGDKYRENSEGILPFREPTDY